MPKTIRFSELVKTSGRPQVATLWGDPAKDPAFSRAVRENRILTVKQNPTGSKKDVGQIGFNKDKNVSYFIFPEPLPEAKASQVIGIKYDLLQAGKPIGEPVAKGSLTRLKKEPKRPPAKDEHTPTPPKEPQDKQFTATIRRTAVIETAVTVRAKNRKQAEALALEEVRKRPFDNGEAVVRDEIRGIDET